MFFEGNWLTHAGSVAEEQHIAGANELLISSSQEQRDDYHVKLFENTSIDRNCSFVPVFVCS